MLSRSPVNAWLDRLRALAAKEGVEVFAATERKVKKSGVWRMKSPEQFFAEAQARVAELRVEDLHKQQELKGS
jgi:hypothetical protein